MAITPDTKNWTWVLERACPDCGFDSAEVRYTDIPDLVRANAAAWVPVLERPDVAVRPDEGTWSALEYAAHVRD
ncbi:DinB family protein, partial [Rhodococcus oxybenzonivorans]|nr:DinB family protein [Rhodococcus oxybenzonivorans]